MSSSKGTAAGQVRPRLRGFRWDGGRTATAPTVRAVVAMLIAGACLLFGATSVPAAQMHGQPAHPPAASSAQDASCRFVLGFATLRELIGEEIVGECLEDERFNPDNGNTEQLTTGGLLVWRKLDNWTAFTDGHLTWVNGPFGLERRLNVERFSWEYDPPVRDDAGAEPFEPRVTISEVTTSWGPAPDALVLFPYVRFNVTNHSTETIPIFDEELAYFGEFYDARSREPYGDGRGSPSQVGIDGLRPGFGDEVLVQGIVGFRRDDPSVRPPELMVDLYQGKTLMGERRHVGTFAVSP